MSKILDPVKLGLELGIMGGGGPNSQPLCPLPHPPKKKLHFRIKMMYKKNEEKMKISG